MRSKPSNLDVKFLGRKKARQFAAIAPKVELPLCVQAVGCYCAGHARGNTVDAPCDTSEEVMPNMSQGPWGVIADLWEVCSDDEATVLERLLLKSGWCIHCECGNVMDYDDGSCPECRKRG